MFRQKILTRTIWMVSLVSLFTDIASEMLYPVMPVFLKSIGFSVVLIGILEGFAEAIAGLSKGFFGEWSDKIQKRVPFIRLGYLFSAVSKPMMALFTAPWWIFLARSIDRVGKGIRTGARDALLSDETTPATKGQVFGFHRGMDTLGASIGPIIALVFLLAYPANYSWLFLIAFFPGIVAVSITLLIKDKRKKEKPSSPARFSFFSYLNYWKIAPKSYKMLVAGLLMFTLFNSSDAFLLLYLKNKGYRDTQMIGFYIFYNLFYAFLSYPIGIIADKIGLKKILIAGLLLFSLVYSAFPLFQSWYYIAIIFAFYSLYAAATEGVSKALITNLVDKTQSATAIGFYASFASISTLLASSLAGIIWYTFSPRVMFWFSGIGVLLTVLFLARMFQSQK